MVLDAHHSVDNWDYVVGGYSTIIPNSDAGVGHWGGGVVFSVCPAIGYNVDGAYVADETPGLPFFNGETYINVPQP